MNFEKAIQKALDEAPERNFTETVELILNFREVDFSNPNERIDKEITLPGGRGKKIKTCVIAKGETATEAREVADKVLGKDDVKELGEDNKKAKKIANEYDHFIAEASLMADVGKHLGQVLGPRNKMPKPIPPGSDPSEPVEKTRNRIKIKVKGKFMPTLQAPIGTREMDIEDLVSNAERVYEEIRNELPKRDENIKEVYVKTTMGPTVEIGEE